MPAVRTRPGPVFEPGTEDEVRDIHLAYQGIQYSFSTLPPEPQSTTGPYDPRKTPKEIPYNTARSYDQLAEPEFKLTKRKHPYKKGAWLYTRTFETRPHKEEHGDRVDFGKPVVALFRFEDTMNFQNEMERFWKVEKAEYLEWREKHKDRDAIIAADKKAAARSKAIWDRNGDRAEAMQEAARAAKAASKRASQAAKSSTSSSKVPAGEDTSVQAPVNAGPQIAVSLEAPVGTTSTPRKLQVSTSS